MRMDLSRFLYGTSQTSSIDTHVAGNSDIASEVNFYHEANFLLLGFTDNNDYRDESEHGNFEAHTIAHHF